MTLLNRGTLYGGDGDDTLLLLGQTFLPALLTLTAHPARPSVSAARSTGRTATTRSAGSGMAPLLISGSTRCTRRLRSTCSSLAAWLPRPCTAATATTRCGARQRCIHSPAAPIRFGAVLVSGLGNDACSRSGARADSLARTATTRSSARPAWPRCPAAAAGDHDRVRRDSPFFLGSLGSTSCSYRRRHADVYGGDGDDLLTPGREPSPRPGMASASRRPFPPRS